MPHDLLVRCKRRRHPHRGCAYNRIEDEYVTRAVLGMRRSAAGDK